jgi:Xaa-Pro dipeptidase
MNQERLIKILADLAENGLSQMVITDPSAIFYLTGIRISPGERLLALYLRANGNFRLIVNRLFDVPEGIGAAVEWYGDNEDGAALLARFTERHRPLGVDKNMAARFLLRLMELGAASSFVCASGSVDLVRARKDAGEIERMRRVSQLNDRAMELVRRHIRAGLTEEELADFILLTFRRLGAEGVSFDPLVGFGPNAAGGHHAPGTAVLREGDCVLVDMGCKLDGYCSDMTRTFFYRSVSDKMRKVYETVRAANEAARASSLLGPVTVTVLPTGWDISSGSTFTNTGMCRKRASSSPSLEWSFPSSRASIWPARAASGSRIWCWSPGRAAKP